MEPVDYTSLNTALDGDSIGLALLTLSAYVTERSDAVEVGTRLLDELASAIPRPTPTALIDGLFGDGGFRGDVINYHAEGNSLLDRVLERRIGMPITLSAMVIEVGQRIGMPLRMVGMPGHVVVGTERPNRFIDAFGGTEVDSDGLQRRFESIFGQGTRLAAHGLDDLDAVGAVNRVCNNLTRTWESDRTGKLDRLLTLRAAIPGSEADRKLVLGIAESRGRFDVAASIREELNPEDPQIDDLWARLN